MTSNTLSETDDHNAIADEDERRKVVGDLIRIPVTDEGEFTDRMAACGRDLFWFDPWSVGRGNVREAFARASWNSRLARFYAALEEHRFGVLDLAPDGDDWGSITEAVRRADCALHALGIANVCASASGRQAYLVLSDIVLCLYVLRDAFPFNDMD